MNKKKLVFYIIIAIVALFLAQSQIKRLIDLKNSYNLQIAEQKGEGANGIYEYPDYDQGNYKVAITQALIMANSATSKDKNNKNIEYVHYIIHAMINTSADLSDNLTLKSAKITNIEIKYSGPGQVKIIAPSHAKTSDNLSYYLTTNYDVNPFDLPNNIKTINFKLANTDEPQYIDEIGKYNTGTMQFAIAIVGVGKYNRTDIFSKYGKINSTKVFEYAQVNPKKLDTNLEFDVIFTFSNNKTEKHHIKAFIYGQELYNSGHFNAIDNVKVE